MNDTTNTIAATTRARAKPAEIFDAPRAESHSEWHARLAREAAAAGRDIPASWITEYEDGADGCMPSGWYLTGLDNNGMRITWPFRHEYGPFVTEGEALTFASTVHHEIPAFAA